MTTPFHDLDAYAALPRVAGLALSPDGTRLVTTVATVAPDGKRRVNALWQLDPTGATAPRRLTRSAKGESTAAFLPDGSVLFTSARPDPGAKPDDEGGDEGRSALWLLPAGGGEARLVADPPAGVGEFSVARAAGTVAVAIAVFPGTATLEEDAGKAKSRKDRGVTAQLFETYPIRMWDHYLGPRGRRLFVAGSPSNTDDDARLGELRQIAVDDGFDLDDESFDITPDGSTVVATWARPGSLHNDLFAIDTATGERRLLATDASYHQLCCAPDSQAFICVKVVVGTPERADVVSLLLVDLRTGEGRDPAPGLDLGPAGFAWAPDGAAVFFVADQDGRAPAFRLDLATGALTRLSRDGAFGDLCVSPDGTTVYGLRSTMVSPPGAVALDAHDADQTLGPVSPSGAVDCSAGQTARAIPTPGLPVETPSRVEELVATAADGTPVRSWLALPPEASAASPAPLVVAIHGGPNGSWNAWQWRWNPHLLTARGYAVLLPDPALSTGYGQGFLDRGRGRWGDEPFTDLMAAVDHALERPDLDASRTAAAGGSFGGYMANWVAGHTNRFRCIVTHASLWALDQFHGTTDHARWWESEFGNPYEDPSRYRDHSPHRHVGAITTPMLVIHGELDHRVPIGEALRLWTDLTRHGVDAKFLYFPDENHWVLKPQHTTVWYQTVLAFLDQHLLGKGWEPPALL